MGNKYMTKGTKKSTENQNKPFASYYEAVGKACGCSGKYARMVLKKKLGKYQKRDTELVNKIREKDKELRNYFR